MKNNLNKLIAARLLICLLILLPACDNILETIPTDRISSEVYWQSEEDALYASNAIYRYLDGIEVIRFDGMTDILHANIQFSDWAAIERGEYDSNMGYIQTLWTQYYKGIRAVNYFLENADRIEADNRRNLTVLSAEVRTIRAYLYIQLIMSFGDIPLVTTTMESVQEGKSVQRNPVSEIWSFINKELTETAAELPVKATSTGRITKGAALALKARANLYQGNWNAAADAAKAVMELGEYSLHPSYEKLFLYENENNKEVILDKQFLKDSYSNNMFTLLAPFSQKQQGPTYVPTKNIFDAYEDNDPRLSYSIYLPGDILPNGDTYNPEPGSGTQDEVANTYLATSLGYNIKKYINPEDLANPGNCGINIMLIRYAEVLLTYAEAMIEQDKIDASVLSAINQVRQREDVKMPEIMSGLSQSDMREIVRRERLVELAFEGLRLFDCRRWRTAEVLFPGKVYGMTYKANDGSWKTISIGGFVKVFDPGKHYLFPIPQKDMDLNPTFIQNPKW
ncbi:MAG: RagB/SusD family nutrient uptake outer membrane protein [Tannerellaceae bacterium]|nr:RagB/SusD family nutrient uptake outer membrane protein [Tannerellaceae bacterium]